MGIECQAFTRRKQIYLHNSKHWPSAGDTDPIKANLAADALFTCVTDAAASGVSN